MTETEIEAGARTRAPVSRTWPERLLAALPLAMVFVWLSALYAIEAYAHGTPWLFADELEWTQLSRAFEATGHAARRGEPISLIGKSLYAVLIAPAWAIRDTQSSYQLAKLINVVAMTATAFPAYFLARMLVRKPAAVFVAAGAVSIPALSYTSFLIPEVIAYPYFAVCLLCMVKALAFRDRRWIAPAVALALAAPLVRGQLVVIPAIFALSAVYLVWAGAHGQRLRRDWTRWDRVGAFVLAVGALILLNRLVGSHSQIWQTTSEHWKGRIYDYGAWSAGALAIGLGLLPVVAGIASLWTPSGASDRLYQVYRAVFASSLLTVTLYTGVKAAYLSTVFASRIEERNMIYLSPLFLLGTAVCLEWRRPRWPGLAAGAATGLYLVLHTPYQLDHPYFEAPGYANLVTANRNFAMTPSTMRIWLLGILAVSVALLAASRGLEDTRRASARRHGGRFFAVVASAVLFWTISGEIGASISSNEFSRTLLRNFGSPPNWVDRATGNGSVLFLGQHIRDSNGIWLVEFWNRSIKQVWSLDGSAPGPGPTVSPDLIRPDGALGGNWRGDYVLATGGVRIFGSRVARRGNLFLYRIRPPLRLDSAISGQDSDGWVGSDAAYSQFHTPGGKPGFIVANVSRAGFCGAAPPGRVRIDVGRLVIADKQPSLGRRTGTRQFAIASCKTKQVTIRAPKPPIRVEIHIDPTFRPSDYGETDVRDLGAQVSFAFERKKR